MKTKDGKYYTDAGCMEVLLAGGWLKKIDKEYSYEKDLYIRLDPEKGRLVDQFGDSSGGVFGRPMVRWEKVDCPRRVKSEIKDSEVIVTKTKEERPSDDEKRMKKLKIIFQELSKEYPDLKLVDAEYGTPFLKLRPFKTVDTEFFLFVDEDATGWNVDADKSEEEARHEGRDFKQKFNTTGDAYRALKWTIESYIDTIRKDYNECWSGLVEDAGLSEKEAKEGGLTPLVFPEEMLIELGIKKIDKPEEKKDKPEEKKETT